MRFEDAFECDLENGKLYWKVSRPRAVIGEEAGTLHPNGYRYVQFDKKKYRTHRLVWYFAYGCLPQGDLDHIDMDRANNSIHNLRECTKSQNNANRRKYGNNTSGYKGVREQSGRFVARIRKDTKDIHIGCFATPEDAASAYNQRARELYGDFAQTNRITK